MTRNELARLRANDAIAGDTLVWRKGQREWQSLADAIPEVGAGPPPLPFGAPRPKAIKKARPQGWTDTSPHPWRRYFARMFDIYSCGFAALLLFSFALGAISPSASASWSEYAGNSAHGAVLGYLMFAAGFLVGGLILGLTGTTLGKWIFGIRVTNAEGNPIGPGLALKRELSVLTVGLCLGLPLLSLFTLVNSYQHLQKQRVAAWDKDFNLRVTYRNGAPAQVVFGLLAVGALILAVAALAAIK